ncbi:outer membrane protein assembly factor BamA [Telmatospirillum siberiense]|uniref:Outer membrane protein assembly factor BamA n=2 Tax=Telmatospirillum siberiense TaxID=382514 RepID=A0A2N3PZF4_9PROT|nr:outer membrane protein assembly factor BamA [Telmatospirillum siberiense]
MVQGNQRVEEETVRSYMALAAGDSFDETKIDKSLKSLFATGLFADVSIRREGDGLVVRVVENPIINRLAFEGNKRVKSEQLQTEVQLKTRSVYTRTKVQADVKRILDIYRRNGRFAATVDPKIIELPQNRVDLVFEINEGPPTYVRRINFVGNKIYTDNALRENLQTKEERWYRFLTSDDTYDPDRVNYDRELLRRFYLKNGYADFRVVSTVAELSPDRESFFITYTLEEGLRYKLGKISVKSAIKDLKAEELEPVVQNLETGDWYNADEVESTIQALTDAVGTKGYAFVDVRPVLNRHREDHTIDILFDVQEGPRVFVERVDIQGNVRTLDKVIRREFRLVEGDAFNTAKLRRSRERIKDLNFFDKAEVTNVPSDTAPDRTVIKVDVTEKSTGELSFGVGWSSAVGALLNVGATERNLLGRGQTLSINAQLAQKQTSVSLGFTEPYFLDRHLAAGFDLFAVTNSNQTYVTYDVKTVGFDLRTGWAYNEYLSHSWKYTGSMTTVDNIQDGSSQYIYQQKGTSTLSSVGHTLLYDRRDSKIDPTSGYYLRGGNEFAGVGGTERFVRNSVGAGQYFKLDDQTVLMLSLTAGEMFSWDGSTIRINERYYLGGDTLRGFRDAGVSPRDASTNDAIGGMWDAVQTTEVRFPLGLPKELAVQGKLFADVGTIGPTDSNIAKSGVNETSAPRASIGTGVVWRSPMGPINIDLGLPVLKQSHDQMQIFRLNFGTRF